MMGCWRKERIKVQTIKEAPAYVLRAGSYNGDEEPVVVSFNDLRKAKVGDRWENKDSHNCGRALWEEALEVVYKTDKGVAVLLRAEGTTDDPNPVPWKQEPRLAWFEFAEGAGECDG